MFPSHIEVAESDESTFNRIGNVPEAVDGRREHFSPENIDIFTIFGYFCKPQKYTKTRVFYKTMLFSPTVYSFRNVSKSIENVFIGFSDLNTTCKHLVVLYYSLVLNIFEKTLFRYH